MVLHNSTTSYYIMTHHHIIAHYTWHIIIPYYHIIVHDHVIAHYQSTLTCSITIIWRHSTMAYSCLPQRNKTAVVLSVYWNNKHTSTKMTKHLARLGRSCAAAPGVCGPARCQPGWADTGPAPARMTLPHRRSQWLKYGRDRPYLNPPTLNEMLYFNPPTLNEYRQD